MQDHSAQDDQESDTRANPARTLANILDHHAAKRPAPRSETDRRTNYRKPPTPPGVNLAGASIEEAVFRDPEVIEHAYEVARATAPKHATDRLTIRIPAANGRQLIDYFAEHRPSLPPELGTIVDATLDRHVRLAYASSTRARLVCPHCNGLTVVPTPDLTALLCLDYECAPTQPRRIDPTHAMEPERRVTAKQLALLAGESTEAAMRKRLWREKIEPVHTGAKGRREYRWADVAYLVKPRQKPATPPTANRESRSGRVMRTHAA